MKSARKIKRNMDGLVGFYNVQSGKKLGTIEDHLIISNIFTFV